VKNKFLLVLCVVSLFSQTLPTSGQPVNGIWYVSSADSLRSTITKIGKLPATVELVGNTTYPIPEDLTVPENITLRFQNGAVFSVAAKKALTIQGGIEAGLYPIFSGTGVIRGEVKVAAIFPQWFGAKGNSKADDTVALQRAVDFAGISNVFCVNLNRGQYRITKTLDCTNTRVPGTIKRDGLKIFGSSFTHTAIIGETGKDHAVIETSGSQWLEFDNFSINAGPKNSSTVGIFTGCPSVLPQSQNQIYHVCIGLGDDMTANGGNGTIGLWNFAAEEHTYKSLYISANRPVVLTAYNGTNGFNYPHSYVKLLAVHSLGVTTFTGECFLVTVNKTAPAVTTVDVNSLNLQNTYLGNVGTFAGKNTCAFDIRGSLTNFTYSGTIEGLANFAQISGELINANVNCVFGGVANPKEAVLALTENGKILNCDFKIALCEYPGRNLFKVIGAENKNASCKIGNSTFKTNQTKEWITLPEILRARSSDVVLSNTQTRYLITAQPR
jgi:hypothetical protein